MGLIGSDKKRPDLPRSGRFLVCYSGDTRQDERREAAMYYTTHGAMTAADLDEIRRDMDLDLCGCCESGIFTGDVDEDAACGDCGHDPDEHAA